MKLLKTEAVKGNSNFWAFTYEHRFGKRMGKKQFEIRAADKNAAHEKALSKVSSIYKTK